MERDSFIFYRSFYEAIKELPNEEQLKVYTAITEYALSGQEIEIEGISKAIFTLVKPQIDANTKRYENGKKGGRKPKQNQKETKVKANVNDNVNDNVNVNGNANNNVAGDSCVDGLQEVLKFYEDNVGILTPFVVETLTDYLYEMDYEVLLFAMKISVDSNIRTLAYIKGTLNNWSKKGIKTLLQAKEENKRFKNNSALEEFLNDE